MPDFRTSASIRAISPCACRHPLSSSGSTCTAGRCRRSPPASTTRHKLPWSARWWSGARRSPTATDFGRLAELAQRGKFTHSFGDSGDPAAFWRQAEAGGEPLAALVHFLNRPFATRPAGEVTQYVWPRAYNYESWDAVPAEAREDLRPIYGPEDFERFARFGGYTGYRIGIGADGDWLFFVAGD